MKTQKLLILIHPVNTGGQLTQTTVAFTSGLGDWLRFNQESFNHSFKDTYFFFNNEEVIIPSEMGFWVFEVKVPDPDFWDTSFISVSRLKGKFRRPTPVDFSQMGFDLGIDVWGDSQ